MSTSPLPNADGEFDQSFDDTGSDERQHQRATDRRSLDTLRKATNTSRVLIVLSLVLTGAFALAVKGWYDLKTDLYDNCLTRVAYDQAADDYRQIQAEEFDRFSDQEMANKFIDETLRAQRVQSWTRLRGGAERVLDTTPPPSGCDEFK